MSGKKTDLSIATASDDVHVKKAITTAMASVTKIPLKVRPVI
jgi:hypothetical protein